MLTKCSASYGVPWVGREMQELSVNAESDRKATDETDSVQGDTVYGSGDVVLWRPHGQTSPMATAAPEVLTGHPSGSAACLIDCGGDADGLRLAVNN